MGGYDGNGNYGRYHNWQQDAANGLDISAPELDQEDNGFASGLSIAVTRDGQGKMGADFLPAADNSYNLGTPVARWKTINGVSVANIPTTAAAIGAILYPQSPAELTAGVTPTAYNYIWDDVRRYGATGNGIADDTAAFTTAALVGEGFIPSVGYTWNLSAFVPGLFWSDGTVKWSNPAGYARYQNLSSTPFDDNDNGAANVLVNNPSILILGDSITVGTGAPNGNAAYSWYLQRSLMNAQRLGTDFDPGVGYGTTINQQQAVLEGGLGNTGSYSATGLVGSRLALAAGQTLTIQTRSVISADVIYDGSVSTGSLAFSLNGGAAYSTQAVSGSALNSTSYPTMIQGGALTNESDTVTITAVGGTVVITGVVTSKATSTASFVYVAGQGGTTFGDFTGAPALAEIAYYLNFQRSGNEKLLVLALGTNSLYSAGKATTPAAMITQVTNLIAGLVSGGSPLVTNLDIAIAIPPRSNEALKPVITAGYTHADYVNALVAFCVKNRYLMIRNDKTILSTGQYYADGLHPATLGHRIMAGNFCKALGIPFNPQTKTAPMPAGSYPQCVIPLTSPWGNWTGATVYRPMATRVGNQIVLSGLVQPNGSVSTTVGQLPIPYRPNPSRAIYLSGITNVGGTPVQVQVQIDTSGNIILPAVPTSNFSLDGLTYTLVRP